MPEINYVLRLAVLQDAIERTHITGAYQARAFLESYIQYLEVKEHERLGQSQPGTDSDGS
jgi:hypothetical protein